ncbi:unnamed protein product [Protopolystoma xenopodis]|uniref:Uncharacterized protein n=1 Tax=Protopolystoma xenopodis TaxID=117903 RepID=A0A3S5C6B8_9PLAT|nr:unnamed protein product [Protopolystoma xenopodis]
MEPGVLILVWSFNPQSSSYRSRQSRFLASWQLTLICFVRDVLRSLPPDPCCLRRHRPHTASHFCWLVHAILSESVE